MPASRPLLRVGHKGADALAPGNTIESFQAARDAAVDVIELDVLRPRSDFADGGDWRRAPAGPAAARGEPLLVAHDWGDAARRTPLELSAALDAFTAPLLDDVEIDLDLKIAGREDEVVEAVRARGLLDRARVSTMELSSLRVLRDIEPALRRGWTVPRVTRAWDRKPWARPAVIAAVLAFRRRLPALARSRLPELGASSMWAYHPVVTPALARACESVGAQLIAWTVDDLQRMRSLVAAGVHGICTNDPLLFERLGEPEEAPRA